MPYTSAKGGHPYARPRIKPEHRPIRRADDSIQIGGDLPGIASVIEDPGGALWQVLGLLDGERTPEEVVAASGQPGDLVASVLDALYTHGFLEDAAAEHTTTLTASERERYSRSQAFYRWIDLTPRPTPWTPQERIKAGSVVVLGVGGAGSSVALALAAAGVGNLHLVDHDQVELSNLTRQFLYTEADLGRSKVQAAVERLRAINSTISVTGEEAKVESAEDLDRLVARCDVLALCADRPREIEHWAAAACERTATPWVTGGYVGPLVRAMTFVPGTGPCFECLHLRDIDLSAAAPEPHPDVDHGPGNDELAASTATSAGVVGMLLAHAVLAHLTGAPDFGSNFAYGLNLAAPQELVHLAPERHPRCPLCAGRP